MVCIQFCLWSWHIFPCPFFLAKNSHNFSALQASGYLFYDLFLVNYFYVLHKIKILTMSSPLIKLILYKGQQLNLLCLLTQLQKGSENDIMIHKKINHISQHYQLWLLLGVRDQLKLKIDWSNENIIKQHEFMI